MGQRLQLQNLLKGVRGEGEEPVQTYFQEPSDTEMVFPCILYDLEGAETEFAGNRPYRITKRYLITYITDDPDDRVVDLISQLPSCTFDRKYKANNKHHFVFNIFF